MPIWYPSPYLLLLFPVSQSKRGGLMDRIGDSGGGGTRSAAADYARFGGSAQHYYQGSISQPTPPPKINMDKKLIQFEETQNEFE